MSNYFKTIEKANPFSGFYIGLDGIVGSGKDVQIGELGKYLPIDFPGLDILFTYEPGGNEEADVLRQKLKYQKLSPQEEVELFKESREITLESVVRPVLERGGLAISNRLFTASLAYQGFGRRVGMEKVWKVNELTVRNYMPDVFCFMNVGLKAALARSAGDNPDKFDNEDIEFWEETKRGFVETVKFLREVSPFTKILTLDDPEGSMDIEETRIKIKNMLYPLIEKWQRGREGMIVRERQ